MSRKPDHHSTDEFMKITTTALFIVVSFNLQAQTGTFIDERDGNTYQTITIGNKIWFREHLRLKTSLSYYPNFSKHSEDFTNGNYYSHLELDSLCPKGWRMATLDDLEDYIREIALQNNIPDSAILRSISPNRDSSSHILIGNLNPLQDTLLNLLSTGWVEGNKLEKQKSLTLWMRDTRTNDIKYHAHIGPLGYIIHTHLHNVIDKQRRVRKFSVRCVCEKK